MTGDERAHAQDKFSKWQPVSDANFNRTVNFSLGKRRTPEICLQPKQLEHAPQKTRLITVRPCATWYTDEIADAKKQRRRAERRWLRTKDSDDRLAYVKACKSVNLLIDHAKSSHYTTVVSDNKGNQKGLFTTVNKLLHQNSGKMLPSSGSDINKVSSIHEGLSENSVNLHCKPSSAKVPDVSLSSTLSEFKLLS